MGTQREVDKPYRISGLLGIDSYATHAAAAVIWTLSGVSPPFHVDCAVSLSISIERLGSGKRTQEPLLQRGKWLAPPRRVSCAFLHAVCPVLQEGQSSCLWVGTWLVDRGVEAGVRLPWHLSPSLLLCSTLLGKAAHLPFRLFPFM